MAVTGEFTRVTLTLLLLSFIVFLIAVVIKVVLNVDTNIGYDVLHLEVLRIYFISYDIYRDDFNIKELRMPE